MIRPGDMVSNCEVLAILKDGGMASLYLGRRKGIGGFSKLVAIKVIHEELATDQTFVQMFVDEAVLQSRIHHPNVVHVEELGEAHGSHYLVMEFVNGCSLGQLLTALSIQGRRLTTEVAVYIACEIAQGLHAAHELKDNRENHLSVVHRDVSPQNALLSFSGHIKLIDFGIAKARGRLQQTQANSIKGKIRYMSPEQARGKGVDRRTDVYALGIVLWETLTMRRLFAATNDTDALVMVRDPKILPPSHYVPELSEALDKVILCALAKNPDDRFQTALAMRRALLAAVKDAQSLDASHLADLLQIVVPDQIEEARALIPADSSLSFAPPPPPKASGDLGTAERSEFEKRAEHTLNALTLRSNPRFVPVLPGEEVVSQSSDDLETIAVEPSRLRAEPSVEADRSLAPTPLKNWSDPLAGASLEDASRMNRRWFFTGMSMIAVATVVALGVNNCRKPPTQTSAPGIADPNADQATNEEREIERDRADDEAVQVLPDATDAGVDGALPEGSFGPSLEDPSEPQVEEDASTVAPAKNRRTRRTRSRRVRRRIPRRI